MPAPTGVGPGGPQAVESHSVAVDQLHIQRRQIEHLIVRVNEIASRLET